MKLLIKIVATVTITFAVFPALAQKKELNLTVGKSTDNSYTKGKEAEIMGTFPDSANAKNAWLTNAFAELALKTPKRWSYGLLAEVHRNTLIKKKQDVL